MENPNVVSPDYFMLLLQWLFLFALIAMFLVPAYLFRNLARKYNKKGWVYFIYGLVVGVVAFNIFQLVGLVIKQFYTFENGSYTAVGVMYLAAVLLIWGAYKVLQTILIREKTKQEKI